MTIDPDYHAKRAEDLASLARSASMSGWLKPRTPSVLAGGVFVYPSHSRVSYSGGHSTRLGSHVGRADWRSGHGGRFGIRSGRLRRHSRD